MKLQIIIFLLLIILILSICLIIFTSINRISIKKSSKIGGSREDIEKFMHLAEMLTIIYSQKKKQLKDQQDNNVTTLTSIKLLDEELINIKKNVNMLNGKIRDNNRIGKTIIRQINAILGTKGSENYTGDAYVEDDENKYDEFNFDKYIEDNNLDEIEKNIKAEFDTLSKKWAERIKEDDKIENAAAIQSEENSNNTRKYPISNNNIELEEFVRLLQLESPSDDDELKQMQEKLELPLDTDELKQMQEELEQIGIRTTDESVDTILKGFNTTLIDDKKFKSKRDNIRLYNDDYDSDTEFYMDTQHTELKDLYATPRLLK